MPELPPSCTAVRVWLSERLDQPLTPEVEAELGQHLRGCEGCREAATGLAALVVDLGRLEPLRFPDDALAEVWRCSVEAPPAKRQRRHTIRAVAGTAVAIALAAIGWFGHAWWGQPGVEELSSAELARAGAQLAQVARLTERALVKTERNALDHALARGVARGLRRVPLLEMREAPSPERN